MSAITNWAALKPLRNADFRVLTVVSALNSVGMMAGQVAIGWYVLQLTDSPFMVGVVMGVRLLPNLFFGIPAGAIADAVDRRHMIQVLNLLMTVPMVLLGLLVGADRTEIWQVFALVFIGGALFPFSQTALTSLAFDITGSAGVMYGLTLMRLAMGVGNLVGSIAIGSVMARIGVDIAFFVLAATYAVAAVVALLIKSRGQAAPTTSTGSARRSLVEFIREIRTNRSLLALTVSTGVVEALGFSHAVLLPSLVRDVLGMDAEGFGLISGLRNLGGLTAILFIVTAGDRLAKGLVYQVSIFLFGGLLMALAVADHPASVMAILIGLSAMMTLTDVLSQSLMQLVVPNELRGRAMGSWMVAVGTGPAGSLQVGAVASAAGIGLALSLNGLGLVVVAVGLLTVMPSMRKV
ncbi:MAG: MFS transporter [Dehalococcoidia bacterium]